VGYSPTSKTATSATATSLSAQGKRSVGRFAETRSIKAVRAVFRVLCTATPTLAAHMAYALLAKPPRGPELAWQKQLREKALCWHVPMGRGNIAVYQWGEGPTVLMVHGWGARATHMGKMIEPLVAAGYRVVAFDAPGHGQSFGRSTDPVEFAAAIAAVARRVGPLHTVLAHSFGVAMAQYAQRDWGVQAQAQVCISSFDDCQWFTHAFSKYVGVKPAVMEQAKQMMVKRYRGRLDWNRLSVVDMLRCNSRPTLIIHDQLDGEIPFEHSVALQRAAPHAEFHATSGLGHHKLLGSKDVISRVVGFVQNAI
jgi:pimeloyl-ACP methyl ester carboxylesterase